MGPVLSRLAGVLVVFVCGGVEPVGKIALDWFSDWATQANGTTNAIVQDTVGTPKWTGVDFPIGGSGHQILSSSGLGFPASMTKVFAQNCQAANDGFCYLRTGGRTVPGVGETLYMRWYVRMVFSDLLKGEFNGGLMNGDHPWKDGNTPSVANFLFAVDYADGSWYPFFTTLNASETREFFVPPANFAAQEDGPLAKNATHRIELALQRLTSTTYQPWVRIYDTDDSTLLYDTSDFVRKAEYLSSNGATVLPLSDDGDHTFRNVDTLGEFGAGINDFQDSVAGDEDWEVEAPMTYSYQGGFARRVTTVAPDAGAGGWIGRYGRGSGEP
jgi:hypothetical protein